ncbi:hypothetical protein [Nocardioides sp.]|uniref:hypothetical protein n=1 Tax=Nocardioides sp. TaxID=35761 RepID=UPI003D0E2532
MRHACRIVLSLILAVCGLLLATSPTVTAVNSPQGQLVSATPATGTPHVLDGRVNSVVQVGSMIILGGTFTQARNDGSQTVLTRRGVLAFNATTGQISTTFNPAPNGAVNVVLPTGDGTSVYVGGAFTAIGGVNRSRVARVDVATGAVVGAFNPGTVSGAVRDLRLAGGRLWLAGSFTRVGGQAQAVLATVDPTSGAFQPYMRASITGVHNSGATRVSKIDITPNGTRLIAVGNFAQVNGSNRAQVFMLDLSGAAASLANHATSFYTPPCAARAFDSYMRDVDFSPDGSFYVISTTGAYGGSEGPCDTTARFETASTGTTLVPSWVNYTGGDTTYAVEITPTAVYVGGHQRWQNNPFAGDRAGAGAVSRSGIAALDPINGLPYSWNPTRARGVGVFDFLFTSQGLWVASDTTVIGRVTRSRIALMPAAGTIVPAINTPTLPTDVYAAGTTGSSLTRRSYNGTTVGAASAAPTGGLTWSNVRGAFMLNGNLYTAWSDGSFTRRSFNGTSYGAAVAVDTSDEIVRLTDWATDIQQSTGMFYDSGRIYFTRSGSNQLFYRYFTPESDVVGAKRLVASSGVAGVDFTQVRSMFTTGTAFYWATPDGVLHRANWVTGAQSGAPVAGTATNVSGPGIDQNSWVARALFLFQGA